jgi:uncharacterized Zn finger protein
MKKNANPLTSILDRDALREWSDERTFERGEEYFRTGQVQEVVESPDGVAGTVLGTHLYAVRLWATGRRLKHTCTCPVGEDGDFCKHGVALGLAWLERPRARPRSRRETSERDVTMEDVRARLRQRGKEELVELVMHRATEDGALRDRLLMEAARKRKGGVDLQAYRKALERVVGTRRYVGYSEMYEYTRKIDAVIDSMHELLENGHAREAIELAEHALGVVERAMERVDDSDGGMGEILRRLEALHLSACKKAKPDPIALASRLFELEMASEFDVFHRAATAYQDVLGPKGLAEYTTLACTAWQEVPALGPGEDREKWAGKRFRITQIMEALAEITEDVDAIVAIKSRDLSSAHDFLDIAETYAKARRRDDALQWAERGVAAFPKATDPRLREFLAAQYFELGRLDEAMSLLWLNFTDHPGIDRYRELKRHSDRAKCWPEWRTRAMHHLRDLAAAESSKGPVRRSGWNQDRSTLVQVHLWENDVDAAWADARAGGCREDLWMELAKRREKQHPEDALFVIQARIEPTLARKDNYAYGHAVRLLGKARELLVRLGRSGEFESLLAAVRAAHRPKRNFMKLLDQERWA